MIGSPSDQNAAQAIFNAAYTPYALFLSLGVAGFPTAIARQVAEYNGQNRFKDSVHVFKYGMLFMLFTGSLCGLLLYICPNDRAKKCGRLDWGSDNSDPGDGADLDHFATDEYDPRLLSG